MSLHEREPGGTARGIDSALEGGLYQRVNVWVCRGAQAGRVLATKAPIEALLNDLGRRELVCPVVRVCARMSVRMCALCVRVVIALGVQCVCACAHVCGVCEGGWGVVVVWAGGLGA